MTYLTVFCLAFQAFVQLLWIERSYTRAVYIPSKQNWFPFMWLATSSVILIFSVQWLQHRMVLVATIKVSVVVLSHTPQCSGRCTATQNLWSTQHQPSFQQILHEVKQCRMFLH